MHKFHNRCLFSVLDTFFTQFNERHKYYARSASNRFYTLPKLRKKYYRIFNIQFKGTKVWNSISENLKTLFMSCFKEPVKNGLVKDYEMLVFLLAVDLFPKVLQIIHSNLWRKSTANKN